MISLVRVLVAAVVAFFTTLEVPLLVVLFPLAVLLPEDLPFPLTFSETAFPTDVATVAVTAVKMALATLPSTEEEPFEPFLLFRVCIASSSRA